MIGVSRNMPGHPKGFLHPRGGWAGRIPALGALTSRLIGHAGRSSVRSDADLLREAVGRAVQRVEPRLSQGRDYPRRYQRPVAHALEYVQALAAAIPGPVEMSPELYGRDPFIHALFGSAEEMQQALCMSHAMHEYARRPGGPGIDAYALMGMRRQEKTAFGMEAAGEVIQREVAQRVIVFTDHTLSGLAPSEAEARRLLVWSLFDSLVEQVAQRVRQRQRARQDLQKEKDYLAAELRLAGPDRRAALQQRLDALLRDLGKSTTALDLHHMGADFDEVLLNPERHLRLEPVRLRLDGMGVLRNGDGDENAHTLDFTDLYGRDRRRWTVVMVHCHPRPELLDMTERLHQASRWLQL